MPAAPAEACVESTGAYTYYPGGYLEPVITSISPSTGPNDASTRVTVFGRNFALPMQVFVGGVEAAVVEIRASQIIFITPQATGPNSSLAGQTVDVVVRNPYTGKDTTSPVQFRYYACPSINTVVPLTTPWNQSTVVTIAGQAFEEPVEVTFEAERHPVPADRHFGLVLPHHRRHAGHRPGAWRRRGLPERGRSAPGPLPVRSPARNWRALRTRSPTASTR